VHACVLVECVCVGGLMFFLGVMGQTFLLAYKNACPGCAHCAHCAYAQQLADCCGLQANGALSRERDFAARLGEDASKLREQVIAVMPPAYRLGVGVGVRRNVCPPDCAWGPCTSYTTSKGSTSMLTTRACMQVNEALASQDRLVSMNTSLEAEVRARACICVHVCISHVIGRECQPHMLVWFLYTSIRASLYLFLEINKCAAADLILPHAPVLLNAQQPPQPLHAHSVFCLAAQEQPGACERPRGRDTGAGGPALQRQGRPLAATVGVCKGNTTCPPCAYAKHMVGP
jgi:hypothetical protein